MHYIITPDAYIRNNLKSLLWYNEINDSYDYNNHI